MGNSSNGEESENHRQFPVGLRVLVIDDDPICLKIVDTMLRSCNYEVTTCAMATLALSMLRERSGSFDLVITDVYMPDMNGYELLEHIGLEMDLPVIMMSADVEVKAAMKGLKHGACFYLMKPVRMEELKNIWQHAVRKKKNDYKEHRRQVSGEDSEILRKAKDGHEHASSENVENSERHKRRKGVKEEDEENDDSSALKKQRVVWLPELHQQFLAAVEKLGSDKAVPKKILELMNVPGLTRENVASHLQKFRGFLRKLSEAREPQGAFAPNFQGCAINKNFESNVHEMLDFKHLVGSSHLSQPANAMPLQSGLSGKTHNLNANVDMLDLSSLHLFNQEPQSKNYLARLRNYQGQPLLNSRRNFLGGGNCTTSGSSSSSESKQFPFMQGSNKNPRFYLSSLRDTATSQMGGLDLDKGLKSNALRAIHQRHQQRSDHISSPQFDTLGTGQMYPTVSQFSNFSSTRNGCSYGRFGHIPSLDSLNGYVTDLPGNSNLFSGLSQERLTFNAPRDVEQVSCMLDEISKSGKEDQQFHNVVLGLEEKAISNSGHACNEMVSSGGFQYTNQYNGTSGCGIPQKNDNCSNAKVGGLSDVLMSLESENNLLPRQVMQDDLHELISPQHDDGVDLMVSDIDIDAYQLDDIHTFSDQV